MEHLNLPRGEAGLAPQVFLLEARAGGPRRCLLDQWIRESGSPNAYLLHCCFAEHGVWAGVRDLLEPVLSRASKNLLDRHSYELSHIFSDLHNRAATPRRSLTDLSLSAERTRNYATDRAQRIIQGLIDFLAGCLSSEDERSPLVLACDSFDEASSLCRYFIFELLRRRGVELSLTLLLAVQDGAGTDFARSLPREPAFHGRVDLPSDPEGEKIEPALVEREALELENRIVAEPVDLLTEIPRITKLWRQAQRHDKVLKWSALALGTYNHYGFYEDARRFCETVSNNIEELSRDSNFFPFWKMTRWNLLGNLFGCYVQLNEPERALEVVHREGLSKIEDRLDRARVFYVLAMLDARYLSQKNFAQAEAYLQEGLGLLKSLPASTEVHFFTTFLENGLALVAHRQGRTEEAVELCCRGLAEA